MAKKRRKSIKRVYKIGQETTVVLAMKKAISAKKKIKTTKKIFKIAPRANLRKEVKKVFLKKNEIKPLKKPIAKEIKKEVKSKLQMSIADKMAFIDNRDFPHSYDSTKVALMVKDPYSIYAYWEITDDCMEKIRNDVFTNQDNVRVTLRIHDLTVIDFNGINTNNYFDIDVGKRFGNWYVDLYRDEVTYMAEIGLKNSQGIFFSLSKSNCVHTPRRGCSHRTEQMWMEVCDGKPIKTTVRASYVDSSRTNADKRTKIINITGEDIRQYYLNSKSLLRDILFSRISGFSKIEGEEYSFILEGDSCAERERIFSLLDKDYSMKTISLGSSQEMVTLTKKPCDTKEDIFSGSSNISQD